MIPLLANEAGFLALLRHSEGTDRQPDPYRVVFGFGRTLANLSNHPSITGEWMGVHDPKWGLTTAAGAYQINRPSWREGQAAAHLPDFTGPSQDAWVLWKLKELHALDMVDRGDVCGAIDACRNIWASLPGGDSGQPQTTLAICIGAYISAGGVVA